MLQLIVALLALLGTLGGVTLGARLQAQNGNYVAEQAQLRKWDQEKKVLFIAFIAEAERQWSENFKLNIDNSRSPKGDVSELTTLNREIQLLSGHGIAKMSDAIISIIGSAPERAHAVRMLVAQGVESFESRAKYNAEMTKSLTEYFEIVNAYYPIKNEFLARCRQELGVTIIQEEEWDEDPVKFLKDHSLEKLAEGIKKLQETLTNDE